MLLSHYWQTGLLLPLHSLDTLINIINARGILQSWSSQLPLAKRIPWNHSANQLLASGLVSTFPTRLSYIRGKDDNNFITLLWRRECSGVCFKVATFICLHPRIPLQEWKALLLLYKVGSYSYIWSLVSEAQGVQMEEMAFSATSYLCRQKCALLM